MVSRSDTNESRCGRRDRGANEALQMVLLGPLVVFIGLLVYSLGNNVDAQAQIRSIAEAAAQGGAVQRNTLRARQEAQQIAVQLLADNGACAKSAVEARTFVQTDIGNARSREVIEVTVRCQVDDGALGPISGVVQTSPTYEVSAVSFFDEYRGTP